MTFPVKPDSYITLMTSSLNPDDYITLNCLAWLGCQFKKINNLGIQNRFPLFKKENNNKYQSLLDVNKIN